MSLIPFLLDLADEISEFNRGVDDDFGFGIYANDFHRPSKTVSQLWLPKHRQHPYANIRNKMLKNQEDKETTNEDKEFSPVGKNGFQVSMNVKQFKPNELTVKTIDNCIVVEGKHEEKEDGHGLIARHFVRKYTLPKGYDPKEVASTLSSDGILTVKAPPPLKTGEGSERIVQIQQTGPAHLSVKENCKDAVSSEAVKPPQCENGDKTTTEEISN